MRSARFRKAVRFILLTASFSGIAYFLRDWFFYPTDRDFPYASRIAVLGVSVVVQLLLWRRAVSPALIRRLWCGLLVTVLGGLLICGAGYASASRTVAVFLAQKRKAGQSPSPRVAQSAVALTFRRATVAMEDGHFYEHYGIDLKALHRAFRADLREKRIAQGGSTITQQLVKSLFLSPDKNLWRKTQELFLAIALERRVSKDEILADYINAIDYGMGQHGVSSAAAFYFHTTPDKLTLAQSAVLVGLVSSPPQVWLSQDQLEWGRQTALDRIALWFHGCYSQEQFRMAAAEPLEDIVFHYVSVKQRGATEEIPANFGQVAFYFFDSPNSPGPIERVNPLLKARLTAFLRDARTQFGLVGIDHLGVYNDRPVRGTETVPSAHAFGQAIDIYGFRLADGTRLQVSDQRNPVTLACLTSLELLLRQHFPIVISWREDPSRHANHFHCEVRGDRCVIPVNQAKPGPAPPAPYDVVSPAPLVEQNRFNKS
jgi:Transglycosylase/Extensin-like protein C-terminus